MMPHCCVAMAQAADMGQEVIFCTVLLPIAFSQNAERVHGLRSLNKIKPRNHEELML